MANKKVNLNEEAFDALANQAEEDLKIAEMDILASERKSEKMVFYIEPSLKKKIVEYSKRTGRSYATIARDALVDYAQRKGL